MTTHLPTPREDLYWDRDALSAEEKRVFSVCNGCRLCFKLCPSFPALFDAIDALDTEDSHAATPRADIMGQLDALDRLPPSVHDRVVDLCYQCKLCDPICPYTPPHEFAVDFPRLMLRHRAVHARQHGVALQDRVLGNPDIVGRLGTMLPIIANAGTKVRLNRRLMEAALGIHRDRKLPRFADQTFLEWFSRTHGDQPDAATVSGRKVVLFYTCSVQWNEPQVGRAAVEVLEHNDITVFAPKLKCCGMPALDGGDVPQATSWAEHNVDILLPYVQAGALVLSPGPTCSYMLKHEWPEYLGTPGAQKVAAASFDLMEYLYLLRKEKVLKQDFVNPVGPINYHLPCHLKVQKIGFRSRDILKKLPGAKVKMVDKCSCMDGTWGMKKEYYDLSKQWAAPMLAALHDPPASSTSDADTSFTLSSDCLIAKLQIEEHQGQPVKHPIEIVWQAYGGKALAATDHPAPTPATKEDPK